MLKEGVVVVGIVADESVGTAVVAVFIVPSVCTSTYEPRCPVKANF